MVNLFLKRNKQMRILISSKNCEINNPANIRLDKDVFRLRLQKMSWRRLEDVLIKTNMFALALRLQDVFKTSWSRPIYLPWSYVFKTSSRPLQGVFKTSSRRFEDVFKMSSRHLQDVLQRYFQDVFKAYHQVNLFYLARPREVFNTFLSTEEFA